MRHDTQSLFGKSDLSQSEQTLLFLMPLVQTAWEHGAIAPREKHLIFTAAREDLIEQRDQLNDTLANFLIYQPSREFFDECLTLIALHLSQMTLKERKLLRDKIISRCRAVAASAGDSSPMNVNHHISPEEKFLLERLDKTL